MQTKVSAVCTGSVINIFLIQQAPSKTEIDLRLGRKGVGKGFKDLLFLCCLWVKTIRTPKRLVSIPINTHTHTLTLSPQSFAYLYNLFFPQKLIPSVRGHIDWSVQFASYPIVWKLREGQAPHFFSWLDLSSSRRAGAQPMTSPITLKYSSIIPLMLMIWKFDIISLS